MMKKNYGVPNLLHKNNALTLHPPHYAGKKCKNALGRPMGVRKMAKMGKNGKYWNNRQEWQKMIKKIMEFSISCLNTMHLYYTHHIMLEKIKKMPWGGP